MALIKCDECGKEVSDKAASCPGCGAPSAPAPNQSESVDSKPAKVTRSGAAWEGLGFVLIIGGMLVAIGSGPDNHFGGAAMTVGFVVFLIGRFK